MSVFLPRLCITAALIGGAILPFRPAWAQRSARAAARASLRGSPASVERMYHEARQEHFTFFETSHDVRHAVARGWLVRLTSRPAVRLHRVGYPFVRPATLVFVHRLGAEYATACGEPLVVTSAVRPETRQPWNSVARSVHPTGMAVDLRRPTRGSCLRWLRRTLLSLEAAGVVEATEEHAPAHFHVAVYPTPYTRYVDRLIDASRDRQPLRYAAAPAATPGRRAAYTVRPGDTLWDIARRHQTTVRALRRANHLTASRIRPGQQLRIPSRS